MTQQPIWQAETSHTGGYLCGHQHRSRQAAERCLPKLPRQRSGSLTHMFSLACVIAMNDAARNADMAKMEEEDD